MQELDREKPAGLEPAVRGSVGGIVRDTCGGLGDVWGRYVSVRGR